MKRILCIIFAITLASCANTTGGAAKISQSGFDGAKVVTIDPHGNASNSIVGTGLGAQWNSKTPNSALLMVTIFNDIEAISGAELMIDGEKVTLSLAKGVTDFDSEVSGIKQSSKVFVTELKIIERITNAKKAWLRVHTPTGYIENAIIDGEKDSKAFHALKRFLTAIKE